MVWSAVEGSGVEWSAVMLWCGVHRWVVLSSGVLCCGVVWCNSKSNF